MAVLIETKNVVFSFVKIYILSFHFLHLLNDIYKIINKKTPPKKGRVFNKLYLNNYTLGAAESISSVTPSAYFLKLLMNCIPRSVAFVS